MATGVLVLLFGEATKLSDVATGCDKKYGAEICFGRATDSHDADGQTTAELAEVPSWIDDAALRVVLDAERARTWQIPPTVSALKVGGQRSYHLTRQGKPPELEPRSVKVHALELLSCAPGSARVELVVSKGYYVRALARDVAAALATPAHLSQLRRLASGCFTLADACRWPPPADCQPVSLAAVLPRLVPTLRLKDAGILRARRGQLLGSEDFLDDPAALEMTAPDQDPPLCAWTDAGGAPVALGQRDSNGFRVKRGFAADQGLQSEAISDA